MLIHLDSCPELAPPPGPEALRRPALREVLRDLAADAVALGVGVLYGAFLAAVCVLLGFGVAGLLVR